MADLARAYASPRSGPRSSLRPEPRGTAEAEGQRLTWTSPTGPSCPLARVYKQPNGMWAALVVAGVSDHLLEATSQAEWAVCRLAS